MRVLLVEDTDDLRFLFARALRLHRCEVREAANGPEALEAVAEFPPDLVVTDLMMPGMDGIELIGRLRAIPVMASVPVVLITADTTPETETRARRAGVADFVVKPIDIDVLLRRMRGHRAAGLL